MVPQHRSCRGLANAEARPSASGSRPIVAHVAHPPGLLLPQAADPLHRLVARRPDAVGALPPAVPPPLLVLGAQVTDRLGQAPQAVHAGQVGDGRAGHAPLLATPAVETDVEDLIAAVLNLAEIDQYSAEDQSEEVVKRSCSESRCKTERFVPMCNLVCASPGS